MRSGTRNPDGALQRTPGASEEFELRTNSLTQTYATCGELQSRHVQKRFGTNLHRSRLIAALCFGEVQR